MTFSCTVVEGVIVAAAVVIGVRGVACAELEARDARREIGRLGRVATVQVDDAPSQVVGVAVDAAGAGLSILAADEHDVVGAVLASKLDPAEAVREEQVDLVDEDVARDVLVALTRGLGAAAGLDLDVGAIGKPRSDVPSP